VSKGTIMSRLFHARRKVKEKLTPYLEGEEEGEERQPKEADAGD
jgi:hypothetical protein